MSRPLITMTLIAKNEKHNVTRCFSSWWDFVDEVVIADTGSDDGTLGAALEFAKHHGQPDKLKTVRIEWTDDFAAARQAADDLATGEFLTWCDLDDTIEGFGRIRQAVQDATDEVSAFFCDYRYATDPHGHTVSQLARERVVRNDGNQWKGRLHEHKLITRGTIVRVPAEVCVWVHHRDHTERTGERNVRILEDWLRDEPGDARIMQSLAMEYVGAQRYRDASDLFARVLACPGEPPDRRAQAHRHLCVMLMQQDRVQEAEAAAWESLRETWLWADTHLTLAEVAYTQGRPEQAVHHAETALRVGMPDTILIINPQQYDAHPRGLMACALAAMGRFDDAVNMAEECLRIAPDYQLVAQHLPGWRGALKRERTAGTVLSRKAR